MIGSEIAEFLEDQGLGTRATNIFLDVQPDQPNDCIFIKEEMAPGLNESMAFYVDTIGIKILVRNSDYFACKTKMENVHKILAGFKGGSFVAGGYPITLTEIRNSPASIGIDERERHEWVSHYFIRYEAKAGSYRRDK